MAAQWQRLGSQTMQHEQYKFSLVVQGELPVFRKEKRKNEFIKCELGDMESTFCAFLWIYLHFYSL